jgi:hypothetical protein
LKQKLKGKICSVYMDKITESRLQALSKEMTLSRSAILRLLVAQKWTERADQFLSAAKSFDEAKNRRETALIEAGIDPADALAFCHRER